MKRVNWRVSNPIFWGVLSSSAVLCFWLILGFQPVCEKTVFLLERCSTKFAYLLAAPPNEVGDSLAGLAGTLAFIWIIVTVALQSLELREQRLVLEQQKEEMEDQKLATQEMASSLREQASYLKDEAKLREELRFREELDQRLLEIRSELSDFVRGAYYLYKDKDGKHKEQYIFFERNEEPSIESDAQLAVICSIVRDGGKGFLQVDPVIKAACRTRLFPLTEGLVQGLEKVLKLRPVLSPADNIRLRAEHVTEAYFVLKEMKKNFVIEGVR
ncbi:MAG: hypothetical protein AAF754_07795 [Pseudomonadota bacterium]